MSITLKIASREGESERYVLRVALRSARETVEPAELALDEAIVARRCSGSPSITVDRCRWLRLGFRHLSRLEMRTALEGMLATAERLDRPG